MFFQYFPVEVSEECLERDDKGRSLFCYLDYKNVSIYSSSPVDCAEYNPNQLQELSFVCYAIAIPGLGIAVAAAFGLAKVATVSIAIFVKLSESVFKMTEKQSHKLQNWRYCCKTFANAIYITVSLAVLTVVTAMLCLFSFVTLDNTSMHYNIPSVFTLSKTFNDSYICLAVLVFFPTAFIIIKLPFHCKQRAEYTSFARDLRPPNRHDWDVELEPLPSMSGYQELEVLDGSVTIEDRGDAASSEVYQRLHFYNSIWLIHVYTLH